MTSESTITVPNPSASRLYSDLQKLHHDSLNWQCNQFFDDEINEQTGKPTMKHDLCEVLAEGWPFKFPAKYRGLAVAGPVAQMYERAGGERHDFSPV
ncbi:hypothetical protein IV203_008293 [Nitzschia inconspicua]|uniref:Uncharacterized protein n=1 Tax=Nitzschia inconspicua TaxID=303405 RepID=A0A9K3L012_9STRA|nr:hypothetical protein IV203_008293 [Nitzschia inconspicua]